MGMISGGQLAVDALLEKGVTKVFSLSGGHINPLYEAAEGSALEIFTTRHEQASVFMAEAWGMLTRKPGVALVTAGPGFSNSLSAIANAQMANSPLLLISGAVGLKAAEALARRGLKVNLLEMGPHPLPQLLDPQAARLLTHAVSSWGVRLHWRTRPLAVAADRGRVRALALDNGRELPTNAVILAVGVSPNTDFLAGGNLAEPGGVVVDEYLRTPDPHIYAAGDCILPHHLLTGRRAAYQIWPAAVDQGRVAGINLTGGRTPYRGLLPQNSLSLRGFHLITGGLGPQETGDCEVVEELDERRGRYRRLVFRDDRLVGLTLAGAIEDTGIYFAIMANQFPVSRLPADPRSRNFHPGRLWG